ncbi:PD-(D/E)XK nuclease family protein [Mycoplasma sp. CSL7503-lung]|uniref:PD-(D/E)XK nuclease family protein n=1 Tax=Mycoplasma sp. CSL7503-lung TaxID=536372 RepID=UPI0021CF4A21|nr:PD-(D/E)XK nuclease family protein [Mycoplasma sp. CSL7503-lung]MCU4706402.1 PD-(D/E)XK nuclease family protein [Mycoplasma sp. CSL7503-lung]
MNQKENFNQIILNRMYGGTYISDYDNIGHEIINLYKSDNGKNYIFLCADGQLPKEHQGYESVMLLIRSAGNKLFKVIGKATGLKQFGDVTKNNDKKIIQYQKDEIKKNKITYGGILLDKIFHQNRFKKNETHNNIYITFEAKKVVKSAEVFYITTDQNDNEYTGKKIYKIPGKTMLGRSSRRYYKEDEIEKSNIYKELKKIINDDSLWDKETKVFKPKENDGWNKRDNLLEIIGKDYDELSYSNLIYYFLNKYPELTKDFVKNVLKIEDEKLDFNNFKIEREWERIDISLWIKKEDQNNKVDLIVIENKIKSNVSKYKDERTQLEKYKETVNKEKNKMKNIDKTYFYVLSPNYNEIKLSNDDWKKIRYSELLNCFKKFNDFYNFQEDQFNKLLFENFIKNIEKQSKDIDNNLEEKSEWIFNKRIIQLKK